MPVLLVVFWISAANVAELVGDCAIQIGDEKVSPCFVGSISAGFFVIIMSSSCFGLCAGQVREARSCLLKVRSMRAKCLFASQAERHLGVLVPLIFVVYLGP